MRNIATHPMYPHSSAFLIKANLTNEKATFSGKTLVRAITKFIGKLNSIIETVFYSVGHNFLLNVVAPKGAV